jgi:hypothetical protein
LETQLRNIVETRRLTSAEIGAATRTIYERVLAESRYLHQANFLSIHTGDLARLFTLYDGSFFDGQCQTALGTAPLSFRLSKRMTMAAGKTGRREIRDRSGVVLKRKYEIAISTTLLFQTFRDRQRPICVTGVNCRDRLEALQRIFEHELVHLIEMLVWNQSSCTASRFQSIASRFFGHTEHTHQLITPHEHAYTQFGIQPGDRVSFRFDGKHYIGKVNRITRRATVLVEDERGVRYSDGKRYAKFYVPVSLLRRTE